ncbi:hypothetical protein MHYP_G00315200 [Metynnis hypsauchen]
MKTLLVEAQMEQLLEEPVKTFPSAESEAEAVTDLMEVVLEDAETHSATSEKEVKMMMLIDAAEAEAIKAFMDISLDENEEEHLDHLVSSDDVGKSISELLEVLFEDAISASVQPLVLVVVGKPRPKKPHWYQHDNRVQRPRETGSETLTHH